ncbi:hypothetical protein BGX27_005169 [Mortierella sp. AM989]|nr:hypothetical protein BGX27_005169 [Mortierella sp. AM989]
MPVFTQICSADPVTETTIILATCTCACLSEGDMIIDSTNDLNSNVHGGLYIRIDGVIHWSNCALYANAINSNFGLGDNGAKNAMALLKQQQQQKVIGGLAVLRKPPVSSLPRRSDPFAPVRLPPTRTSHLYAGSRFRGKQKSGKVSYDVMVDIKDVNLKDSSLCGYLHINGLTEEYPELTTFFDAEIIGNAHSFVTKKWDVDVKTDQEHWTRFKQFEPMMDTFATEKFKYDFNDKDVIFMRWKEHFLVPDHHVEGITGASFAGFYYICYNKSTGEIDGYYFHQLSENNLSNMFGFGEDHSAVYGESTHKSSWTHELIAGAAAFEAMKSYEDKNDQDGHKLTKEIFAALAAAEADKLIETKGLDLIDREKAKYQAKENAERIYDEKYS